MNTMYWLVRRELWENRVAWVLPAAIGAIVLLISLFAHVNLDIDDAREFSDHNVLIAFAGFFAVGAALFAVLPVYVTWYLLDCLFADRKDKSVLFWKSLPISDTATVLSKLAMGLIVVPLIYLIAVDLTLLAASVVVSLRTSWSASAGLWRPGSWLDLQIAWVYLMLTTALWFFPLYTWLMLVSAWAKRAAGLWALLVPLALCYAEYILLNSRYLFQVLVERFYGFGRVAFAHGVSFDAPRHDHLPSVPPSVLALFDPQAFFTSISMWLGVFTGLVFLAGAIALRHRYTEN